MSRLLLGADLFIASLTTFAIVFMVYAKNVASQTVTASPPPPPPSDTFAEAMARVLAVLHGTGEEQ